MVQKLEKSAASYINKIFLLGIFFFFGLETAGSFEGFVFANLGYARTEGLAQTPKGGESGSTSMGRPTFSEIDLNDTQFYELGAGLKIDDYFAQIINRYLHPTGSGILSSDLITHAQFIPAGSLFNMNVEWDWFALGMGKDFISQNAVWVFSPYLQVDWIKYQYQFSAPMAQSSRAFSILGLSVGLKLEYYYNPVISFDVLGEITLPLSDLKIYKAEMGLNYTIASKHVRFIPRMAMGLLELDFEDHQTVPNHNRYLARPQVTLGFLLSFND